LASVSDPKAAHLRDIAKNLLTLWSSAKKDRWLGKAYADTTRTPEICQPHVCVYGTTTPETLWASVSSHNVSDGLLGRMLIIPGDNTRKPVKAQPKPAPDTLVEFVRMWEADEESAIPDSMTPRVEVICHTHEALDRYQQHEMACCEQAEHEEDLRAAIWGRVPEKTAKLSMLFAASRAGARKFAIEVEDVERAIRLSNWSARCLWGSIEHEVADSEHEKMVNRVSKIIREAGVISQNELTRKTQYLRRKDRSDILSTLVESELVKILEEATKTKTKTLFQWEGHTD